MKILSQVEMDVRTKVLRICLFFYTNINTLSLKQGDIKSYSDGLTEVLLQSP